LDILFILESLSEGDALKQAMGKVVDPKSGTSYHLEHKPPPPNDRTYDLLNFEELISSIIKKQLNMISPEHCIGF
jgi:hypothetical protein